MKSPPFYLVSEKNENSLKLVTPNRFLCFSSSTPPIWDMAILDKTWSRIFLPIIFRESVWYEKTILGVSANGYFIRILPRSSKVCLSIPCYIISKWQKTLLEAEKFVNYILNNAMISYYDAFVTSLVVVIEGKLDCPITALLSVATWGPLTNLNSFRRRAHSILVHARAKARIPSVSVSACISTKAYRKLISLKGHFSNLHTL